LSTCRKRCNLCLSNFTLLRKGQIVCMCRACHAGVACL
jgi:hypothetical protein